MKGGGWSLTGVSEWTTWVWRVREMTFLETNSAGAPFLSPFLIDPFEMYNTPTDARRRNLLSPTLCLKHDWRLSWRQCYWESIAIGVDIHRVLELKSFDIWKAIDIPQTRFKYHPLYHWHTTVQYACTLASLCTAVSRIFTQHTTCTVLWLVVCGALDHANALLYSTTKPVWQAWTQQCIVIVQWYRITQPRWKCMEKEKRKKNKKEQKGLPGEPGYRSRYLSHAKRALYHLS